MVDPTGSPTPRVSGPRDPRVVELRRLLGRRNSRSDLVVLEGLRAVREALDAGLSPRTVVVAESGFGTAEVTGLVERLAHDVELIVARDHVFDRLAPSVTPQPVLALIPRPRAELPATLSDGDIVIVLAGVSDPGNTGTLVRVADAVAATCVIVAGGADPWGEKAVRSSAGSILRVPVISVESIAETLAQLHDAGATIVGTDVRGGSPHDDGGLRPPVAIVLGSEAHGLDPALRQHIDEWVHIVMAGRAESLNVAMAGTLLAFEARRRAP